MRIGIESSLVEPWNTPHEDEVVDDNEEEEEFGGG